MKMMKTGNEASRQLTMGAAFARRSIKGQRGFTLIELIIFIVVVGAGLAGILSVSTTAIKSSADPMIRKQTIAIAESMLEEILLKEYCDPDWVEIGTIAKPISPPVCYCDPDPTLTPDAAIPAFRCRRSPQVRLVADKETSRKDYDDVDDFSGYATTTGIVDLTGDGTGLTNYNISSVAVDGAATLGTLTVKKVTVTVTGPQGPITLVGYRANY